MDGMVHLYFEGLQPTISKNTLFLPLNSLLVSANSEDPDEMLHNAAFHLGLHGLPKYSFERI